MEVQPLCESALFADIRDLILDLLRVSGDVESGPNVLVLLPTDSADVGEQLSELSAYCNLATVSFEEHPRKLRQDEVTRHVVTSRASLYRLARRIGRQFDLIVDACLDDGFAHTPSLSQRISALFPLVRKDAAYAIKTAPHAGEVGADSILHRVQASVGSVPQEQTRQVKGIRVSCHWVELIKKDETWLKLTEERVSRGLIESVGADWWRQRIMREGGRETSKIHIYSNDTRLGQARFQREARYPNLAIREYKDANVWPRQVVAKKGYYLPETFRLFRTANPGNPMLRDEGPHAAPALEVPRFTPYLEGPHFYLGSAYPSGYGHALNEVSSRLWAWDDIVSSHPDVRVLVSPLPDGTVASWLVTLLSAYGIEEDRLVAPAGPVVVNQLIGATPGMTNSRLGFADPILNEVWERITSSLAKKSSIEWSSRLERLFVTRSANSKRPCLNKTVVERIALESGFTVIRPESYSFADQAVLFSRATHLAGFGGSGLINALHARELKSLTVVAPETYSAVNEFLIARLKRADVNYFYGRSEIQPERGRFSYRAFNSPFYFDEASDRDQLIRALKTGRAAD